MVGEFMCCFKEYTIKHFCFTTSKETLLNMHLPSPYFQHTTLNFLMGASLKILLISLSGVLYKLVG
jgi:hypothetical protein